MFHVKSHYADIERNNALMGELKPAGIFSSLTTSDTKLEFKRSTKLFLTIMNAVNNGKLNPRT